MSQHIRVKRRAYIGPELILYGNLETITLGGLPDCPNGYNKVGSSPDDFQVVSPQLHGDVICAP